MNQKSALKKRSLFLAVFLFAWSLLGTLPLEGKSLHAIIVADTLDPTCGVSASSDCDNMLMEMQKIARFTGLRLNQITLKGKEVLPDTLLNKLDALDIKKGDVVIFYFSGHGFRTPGKGESPWPNLYFSQVDQGVDYERIGKKLEEYHPHFLLVMADVCNNVIADEFAPPVVKALFMRGRHGEQTKNYKKLFLDVKGVVMVTSSQAGEFAWGTDNGGIFTLAFIRSLNAAVVSPIGADWYTLLDTSAYQTKSLQHPDFRIFLE